MGDGLHDGHNRFPHEDGAGSIGFRHKRPKLLTSGQCRDIRVDVAFDLLDIVRRRGERRVQHGRLGVCRHGFFILLGGCPHLLSNPSDGHVIDKGG